jgi:hypothetical protein
MTKNTQNAVDQQAERLKAALRANLRLRKDQARNFDTDTEISTNQKNRPAKNDGPIS